MLYCTDKYGCSGSMSQNYSNGEYTCSSGQDGSVLCGRREELCCTVQVSQVVQVLEWAEVPIEVVGLKLAAGTEDASADKERAKKERVGGIHKSTHARVLSWW